ncbi:MAG: SUMF1/EgtB/PvdO family nonheme iron enzyme [Myxococcales bacterium]|nr:SUMF1/EgtB/PvdO family nonheme iron enzyme [Myxococcales bacterium]
MSRLLHLEKGSTFAEDYRVIGPLAEGGMGAVYEVVQVHTGAGRALKIMHSQLAGDEKARQRFVQEAKVSALIESDHVVQVTGAGVEPRTGTPWLAMELLKGETMASFVGRRGGLAAWEVREVFSQLCHALSAAHKVGVIHRDLKPENIFLAVARREGVAFTVKVLDFGIAKLVAEVATQQQTAAIGTPLWMAPEQTETGAPINAGTDVWSLGLVVFFAFTGKFYWKVANAEVLSAAALLREVVLEALPAASDRAREIGRAERLPAGFDQWFARCVVREPERRFASVREAREALDGILAVAGTSPVELGPALGTPPMLPVHTPFPGSTPVSSGRGPASDTIGQGATLPISSLSPKASTGAPAVLPDEPEPALPVHKTSRSLWLGIAVVTLVIGGVGAVVFKNSKPPSPVTAAASEAAKAPASKSFVIATEPPKTCPPNMAIVPGGTFFSSTKGEHVSVASYCLDVHEVTVSDFAECTKKGNCTDKDLDAEGFCNGKLKKPDHPINCVDWDQAEAYCGMASKRLPTLAEWTWAARGAGAGTTFPWGDDPAADQLCWSGSSLKRTILGTCTVGSHPSGVTPFGAQDLAGNVAEWVAADPSQHESVRWILGEHWRSEQIGFSKDVSGRTSAQVGSVARKLRSATVGFRCAK